VQEKRAIEALRSERIDLADCSARVVWASVESLCEATVGRILNVPTVASDKKPPRIAAKPLRRAIR
jgi:hypothetical protein